MYLSKLNIWNFRKYGSNKLDGDPSISVNFKEGLNLIVGENDGGKTTIIDAIKFVLGTQSHEIIRLEENDFNNKCAKKELKIECVFKGMSDKEAGNFIEWITFDNEGCCELKVRLMAKIKDNKIIQNISAGQDELDTYFEARDLLRVTYLKPLRDAENELTPGYRSRFCQILKSYPSFLVKDDKPHTLEKYLKVANEKIENYFENDELEEDETFEIEKGEKGAKNIIDFISSTLNEFMGISYSSNNYQAKVNISYGKLNSILSKLGLTIDDTKVGLGSLNELYIAMELLLLQVGDNLKIALIEEVEAHLHPQAQLRLIKYLQKKEKQYKSKKDEIRQYILTTHSITLASTVNLENLIICKNKMALSMGSEYTCLDKYDYEFLERFLDATKANLFFAKGVIFVEGDAENLLIPALSEIIDVPLYKYGISVVNIGSTAFLRYSKIFLRKDENEINIPVSIVTDLDVRPEEYYKDTQNNKKAKTTEKTAIYYIKDLDELIQQHEKLNFDCLNKRYFISEQQLEAELKNNNSKIKRLPIGFKQKIVKETDVGKVKDIMKNLKKEKYSNGTIKLFTNNWTMEYDIALSCIRDRLFASIKIAKDIQTKAETLKEIDFNEYLDCAKEEIKKFEDDECNNLEIAYEIYKPLLKHQASKAVTAQYLAKNLQENKDNIKNDIQKDKYLKYLIDSIKYAANVN
ncbi:ATP-dependent nuclease [Clostridium tyrobutyricum]|uniref:ATP-dependent nuclease n=1 Tax=Clostridium tyrobutyricum TaxID=1519 RepID=UPI002B1F26C2|nr:AAA family ATPase [Clostridium tyrobutyricum]MEA5009131.1 AAA family ATPase [Clostridium tyrobutyricum]